MDATFVTGLAGSSLLVCGAAWPDKKVRRAIYSVKNWLFAGGGLLMLAYSYLGYRAGGSIFFVILELFICLSSLFMMCEVRESLATPVIITGALAFIVWSFSLFEGYGTVIFVIGLCMIGLGYAAKIHTKRREAYLASGSSLVALFSYLSASWIFFWLNLFFALLSGFYWLKMQPKKHV
jgi:hypothetical protein